MCKEFLICLLVGFLCLLARPLMAEQANSIKIGWSGPLSGNSAVLGIDSLQAVKMLVSEVNARGGISGRQLELLAEDDQYDTAKAVTAYQNLKLRGVSVIIASTYGGIFATAERALKDDLIIINPLDCNNDIAKLAENTFCIATESESIGRIIAESIILKKQTPAAVIYDEKNPFMSLVAKVVQGYFSDDPKFYSAGLDQSSADFKTVLLRARSKKINSVVFLGHDPMGQAMREARGLGMQAQFYTVGTITSPGFQKLAGESADGTLVAYWEAPQSPTTQEFRQKFEAQAGRPPILELASIPSYDAAKIVIEALQASVKKHGYIDSSLIKEYLYNIKNYPGLSGSISMDSDGAVRTIRESIYRYSAGKLEKLSPPAAN